MGLSCKIHKVGGKVHMVEAPNTEPSNLYKDALDKVKNTSKALKIWASAYTTKFKEFYNSGANNNVLDSISVGNNLNTNFPKSIELDENGEPKLSDVLNFLNNASGEPLSKSDILEISNNLVSLNIKDIDELYAVLNSTFIGNNEFIINKEKLVKSGIYSDVEISNILKDREVQDNIRNIFYKIEQSIINGDNIAIDLSMYNNEFNIIDYNTPIGIGKFKIINPYEIDRHIANIVGGVKSRKLFEEKLHDIQYPSIIDRYFNDKNFSDKIFDKYSSMKKYNVYKIENGALKNVVENDTSTLLKETLLSKVDNTNLRLNFKFLDSIPDDVWEDSSKNIKKLLKDISKYLIRFNIDVIGIEDLYDNYSSSEIKDFIYDLYVFTDKLNDSSVTGSDVGAISDKIDTYMDNIRNNMYEVKNVDINNQDKTLLKLHISDNVNEVELFERFGIIKTSDESIYHKVEVIDNIDDLYDMVYSIVLLNKSVLPDAAYYPTGYDSSGNISLSAIKDVKNKSDIISDIKRYVNKNMNSINDSDNVNNTLLEKLFIYKKLFKHPLNSNNINIHELNDNFNNFKGDFNYLTDRFISDFRKLQLNEKYNNTMLYKEVLSKFIIDERGITLTEDDPITVSNINTLYSSKLINLKQYSFLSKDSSINTVFNKKMYELTKKSKANIYRNNINLLKRFNGEYRINNNILVSKNSKNDFLRVKEGLFMRVYDEYNNSYYKNIPIYNNSNVNNFIDVTNKVSNIKPLFDSNNIESSSSSIVKLYNNSELNAINEKIDSCEG